MVKSVCGIKCGTGLFPSIDTMKPRDELTGKPQLRFHRVQCLHGLQIVVRQQLIVAEH
jgi:hypothetical protein